MLEWLNNNYGTLLVSGILLLIVIAIVMNIIKQKKNGHCCGSCGSDCQSCPHHHK